MLMVSLMAAAVPAKRGIWRAIRLADGTEVRAQLCGDENLHFFMDDKGNHYVADAGGQTFQRTTEAQLRQRMAARGKSARKAPRQRIGGIDPNIFQGTQRGLVILVEFQDVKFQNANNRDYYNRIINEVGFSDSNGFRGSVKDYFRAQSYDQFTLDFDVMGPVTMPNGYAYYGANDDRGDDLRPGEMTALACQAVASEVNFADYDWDGDGVVDQVYVIYAGQGEANATDANTIWPHSWTLAESDYGHQLTIGGVVIDSYACSNEIDSNNKIEGIGTICHEFSHCMGFPDTYDLLYSGNYGMGNWDLMCSGSYAGGSFCPVGYTSYQRMICGWNNPVELLGDTLVSDMAPITAGGQTFIIYNKGNRDEYYLLENRAKSGWDEFLPGEGMLVLHVDYDSTLWAFNVVNSTGDFTSYGFPGISNDHQRLTILHADNDDDSDYFSQTLGDYWKTTESTDPYPYMRNDSLTNRSKPAATLFNKNLNGRKLLNVAITNIKRNDEGNMSFSFADFSTQIDTTAVEQGVLFYESFDQCLGTGGNDGLWSGDAGTSEFMPDHEDWEGKAMAGANKCAKFGTNSKSGAAKTPEFTVNETAEFSFRAAPFGNDGTYLSLSVSGDATISPTSFTLTKEQWTECNATITGTGVVRVTITPTKRMFLDEVKAIDPNPSAIVNINATQPQTDSYWYTINGVRLNGEPVQKGIYIHCGKKVIK